MQRLVKQELSETGYIIAARHKGLLKEAHQFVVVREKIVSSSRS
jgi:hypothetical protein